MQAIALLFTVVFILINLAVDLLYGAIDPRVRLQRSSGLMATAAPALHRRRFIPRVDAPAATVVAGAVIVLLVLVAILAPLIAPDDPNKVDLSNTLASPSGGHPLGTDGSGRDILSRLIFGARLSLLGPLLVVVISTLFGVPLGLLGGYRGGVVDGFLARAATWSSHSRRCCSRSSSSRRSGRGSGPRCSRSRSSTSRCWPGSCAASCSSSARRRTSTPAGCRVRRLARLAAPHPAELSSTIIAQSTLNFGYALLDLAGLSFLGLGVQPPTSDWGDAHGRRESLVSTPTRGDLAVGRDRAHARRVQPLRRPDRRARGKSR